MSNVSDLYMRSIAAIGIWQFGRQKWAAAHPRTTHALKTVVALCIAAECVIALCFVPLEVLLFGLRHGKVVGDGASAVVHLTASVRALWLVSAAIVLPASLPVASYLHHAVAEVRNRWLMALLTMLAGMMIAGTGYVGRITVGAIGTADGDNMVMFIFVMASITALGLTFAKVWEASWERWRDSIPAPSRW